MMNMMNTIVVLIFAASIPIFGQQKKLQHLPISSYMCQVGLLYLENIEDYEQSCKQETGWCESADARWTKIFDRLENRIALRLRESGRPAGDAQFFKLLQVVRLEEDMMLRLESLNDAKRKDELEKALEGYVVCKGAAKADIKTGATNSQMGFNDMTCMDNPAGIH
jgi:hypothetical protein